MTIYNELSEKDREKMDKLLEWRPKKVGEKIPGKVYEARMSMLCPSDRKLLEDSFKRDGKFERDFFTAGSTPDFPVYNYVFLPRDKRQPMMLECLTAANFDVETGMRILKASAGYDGSRRRDGRWGVASDGSLHQCDPGEQYAEFMNKCVRERESYKETLKSQYSPARTKNEGMVR